MLVAELLYYLLGLRTIGQFVGYDISLDRFLLDDSVVSTSSLPRRAASVLRKATVEQL